MTFKHETPRTVDRPVVSLTVTCDVYRESGLTESTESLDTAGPRRALEGKLEFGGRMNWLSVRDDYSFQGKGEQLPQCRQNSLLVPGGCPDKKFAPGRR